MRLNSSTKSIILELHVNDSHTALELIETIAKALKIAPGERRDYEYVKLMTIRTITKEPTHAR